jgi:tight adherence protein B
MLRARSVALLAIVIGAFSAASIGPAVAAEAAPPADPSAVIRHVDTSAFPLVAVTVSVPSDVSATAVQITENGFPVRMINARPLVDAGGSIQIVLAIDTSNSVIGTPLASAVQAATSFIQQLPPGIGVGLVTFSDRPIVVAPVTTDHTAALQSLSSMTQTRSGTALYDGLITSAGLFAAGGQRDVVLLTDGADTGSHNNLATAVAAAGAAKASVYTIGLGPKVDTGVLQQIADGTHGVYTPAAEADLLSIYRSLAAQLSNEYVIQYRSQAPGGVQLTIVARVGDGLSDQVFVQTPRAAEPPPSSSPIRAFLASTLGMVSVLGLFFLLVLMVGLVLAGSGSKARRDRDLARRMSAPSSPSLVAARPDHGPGAWIPDSFAAVGGAVAEAGGFSDSLERKLERAGVAMTPGEFVAVNAGAVVLAIIVGAILHTFVWGAVLVALAATIPPLVLRRRLNKRLDALHAQLPDVLMILASSMRAGHSFLQALDTVSKEVGNPSGPEFSRVVTEIQLGRTPDDALNGLAERVGTEEFKWAMMAVNVQREVGGNLAEVLDTLAQTVREREAVRRQIRVLSAEGRLSMWLLAAIPPAICLYISWVNPTYMSLLWTTHLGWALIVMAVTLMTIGFFVARKIVRIDV